MARSITIQPKDYGFALAALREQSRPRVDVNAARDEIERQERAVERQRFKHHLERESQRGNSKREAHEAARILARRDAQEHWRQATEHFENHGTVPRMPASGASPRQAPSRPEAPRPSAPQPQPQARPAAPAPPAAPARPTVSRAQYEREQAATGLPRRQAQAAEAERRARSGPLKESKAAHKVAEQRHREASTDARRLKQPEVAAHHKAMQRVAQRSIGGVGGHLKQMPTKGTMSRAGIQKNPTPKGPTQKGKRGGTYRVVNGRKVYLGKDGK